VVFVVVLVGFDGAAVDEGAGAGAGAVVGAGSGSGVCRCSSSHFLQMAFRTDGIRWVLEPQYRSSKPIMTIINNNPLT
jgi:hypothetical protein